MTNDPGVTEMSVGNDGGFQFMTVSAPVEAWRDARWSFNGQLPQVGISYVMRCVEVHTVDGKVEAVMALAPLTPEVSG